MLNSASARRIATAIHAHQSTESMLTTLPEILLEIGHVSAYTLLFTTADGFTAEVCNSTFANLKPGTILTLNPHTCKPSLKRKIPTYFDNLQTVAHGDEDVQTAVIAPLWADGESYGALLLHDIVPEDGRDGIEFMAEQLGLALLRVQLAEEFQRRHAIDAAKLSIVTETGEVLRELEVDVVLAKLMELALSTVSAEVGCVALREADDAELACCVEWGLDAPTLENLRLKTGGKLADTIVNQNRQVIVHNLGVEHPFLPHPILNHIDSLAALPLSTPERVLGCLILINFSASGERDLELLQTVVELSSTAIQNAFLHQKALEKEVLREQLRIAGDIQCGLLPKSAPAIQGITISAWNTPCDESGGDYYDFFQLDDHRLGFVVGDATGHGVGAALIATTTRAFLRALVGSTDDLSQLFARLNDLAAADFASHTYMTLFFGIYDTRDRTLTYAGAGHSPPLMIYRQTRDAFEHLKSTGIPLGIFAGVPYEQKTTAPLEVGNVLLLLTDGVVEAASETGEFFGQERLLRLIQAHRDAHPAALIEVIREAMRDFCGTAPRKDDITLLCLRITED